MGMGRTRPTRHIKAAAAPRSAAKPKSGDGLKDNGPDDRDAERAGYMIVGIGASAGGLDAFRSFFSEMPNDSGMAFVLVQHLDPDYNSALAEDQGENAVGIILSGFGNDGTIGIAAIKEAGGLTLSEAAFDHRAKFGMPQSATAGGFVDYVLQPQEMPACLLEYRDFKNKDAAPGLSESSAAGRAITWSRSARCSTAAWAAILANTNRAR